MTDERARWRRSLTAPWRSAATWRWSVAAAVALAAIALAPQFYLWAERGRDWNGAAFYFFFDEAAYESYVSALVAGRPRLNDPYTGRDAAPGAPQPESLFSIQFVPAYACALTARLFNLSPAAVFILLWPLVAFATTLALSRLLRVVARDERTAAALALAVLCFCTFIQKAVRTLRGLETAYLPLPFLRRYLPALPFALFFIFCLLVWRALTTDELGVSTKDARRASLRNACFAGLTFALLVYSYFYLWTTAAAWLACLALLWLAASPREARTRVLPPLAVVAAIAAASLAPYAWLLARRAPTMDTAQALARTHALDLFRTSELLGALALLVLAFAVRRGRLTWRDRGALLAASFALTPLVVFNQQLITGRSLQPIHYEQFIANYVSLLALALALLLFARGRRAQDNEARARLGRRLLALIALAALGWASVEVSIATRRAAQFNLWTDEARAVYLRLSEIARAEGEFEAAGGRRRVVFCPDIALADRLPTVAPQAVLWSPHMFVFSGVTHAEEKERLYRQLYYSGIDAERFADFISRPHPYRTAVFGSARVLNGLDATRTPVTPADIGWEVQAYAAYVSTFTRERAAQTPLSYVVTTTGQINLQNIDRWHTRDTGQRAGNYTIYRVQLRQEETTDAAR